MHKIYWKLQNIKEKKSSAKKCCKETILHGVEYCTHKNCELKIILYKKNISYVYC